MSQMVPIGSKCQSLPPARGAAAGTGASPRCLGPEYERFKQSLRSLASLYFDGWQGTASVGPLQEVGAAPAARQ